MSHQETARLLREAYAEGAIPPLRGALDANDGAGAYAVQQINTDYWLAAGRRIVGRKIGLTARSVQAQLGVDQPDSGVLFDDMQIEDCGELPAGRALQAKAEAEIALIMGRDLPNPHATAADVFAAAEYALAAIEIVDSRIADWKITFADTVADNGSSAYFVLGTDRHALVGLDLYTCGMAMTVNDEIVSVGAGAACLGHPLNAAAWLARTLAANGAGLRAGDIVLTGALGPMATLRAGDVVRSQIGGLGHVSFTYGGNRA
jgi:2-keto-4-pentenoate hydratase